MSTEITVLGLAGLLQVIQFLAMAIPANLELGSDYLMSARDEKPQRSMSTRTMRLQRAFANHFEALTFFTLAVVVVTLGTGSSSVTATCAWAYLAARVVYVPAYVLGWNPGRTIIWGIGFLATVVMIVAALL